MTRAGTKKRVRVGKEPGPKTKGKQKGKFTILRSAALELSNTDIASLLRPQLQVNPSVVIDEGGSFAFRDIGRIL